MIQHNYWKAKKIQSINIKISSWGIGLILLSMSILFGKKIDFNIVSTVVGIFAMVFGLSLFLLEKVLWRLKIMRFPPLENYFTPILEGRWVGTLTRDNKPHDFVIEIRQSFTSISCITYSVHSSSSAIAAEILYDNKLNKYQFVYYWLGHTKNVQTGIIDTDSFEGFTVLNVQMSGKEAVSMQGEYFTNRQPNQTRGTIILNFDQKELKNGFN